MISELKKEIKNVLTKYFNEKYNNNFDIIIEEPKKITLGDIAIPAFGIVKILRKPPFEVANEIKAALEETKLPIAKIEVVGGYVNVFLDRKHLSEITIKDCLNKGAFYGSNNLGDGKNITLDYSSPNIAKSFSVGHLRSTMIGNSLKLILEKCGYNTYSINYLGDWGTQFGKMIVAYQLWGDLEQIKKDPINELTKLYVRFHKEAVENPALEDQAREAFRLMEEQDQKYLDLWKWIREESLKESEHIYNILNVKFDSYRGESFYNDKMDRVINELEEKHLLTLDQGAQVVDLGEDLGKALIKRSDGGSLYITRDLAAVIYRREHLHFDKILYVVGNEQKLHFKQLKEIIKKMGYDFADDIIHINFGLYLTDGKKASTRDGNVVKLKDVIDQLIALANSLISEKNPDLEDKENVARIIGTSAIVFADLKNYRELDVEFNIQNALKFEGQTGPYLEYSGVRIASILRDQNIDLDKMDLSLFEKEHYFELAKLIDDFENVIINAATEYAPSVIARYLLDLASSFNKFYSLERINTEDEAVRNTNFALIKAVRIVLNEGLRLLGIEHLEKM